MTANTNEQMYPEMLHAPDGKLPVSHHGGFDSITTLTIGSLSGEPCSIEDVRQWCDCQALPNLTHLHLWNISGLEQIPSLPSCLKSLDVQNCPDLLEIASISSTNLELVQLENLENLRAFAAPEENAVLEQLLIRNCPELDDQVFTYWLKNCPQLQKVDLSGSIGFTGVSITEWPENLTDIRCNDCPQMVALPKLPKVLLRLELSGTGISRLPDFPDQLDYVDLSKMRNLTKLPDDWGQFREKSLGTLILHGSGVRVPPAAEHGDSDENVAESTREYFLDVESFGKGEVRGCKIMLLGNDGAGKTCLGLNISGGNPKRTAEGFTGKDKLDTTGGIQIFKMRHPVMLDDQPGSTEIDCNIWDFDGQKSSHQSFLSTGTLYVLLWDPRQELQPGEEPEANWRPLTWWLDSIHKTCRFSQPQIAIVCAMRDELPWSEAKLEGMLRDKIGAGEFNSISCFFIDSHKPQQSQVDFGRLQRWISEKAGKLIDEQGSLVPSYWAIAQNMVENRIKKMHEVGSFAEQHIEMTIDEFGGKLDAAIADCVVHTPEKYPELTASFGELAFGPEHIQRALRFLENTGWVSRKGNRVIIGGSAESDEPVEKTDPIAVYFSCADESEAAESIHDALAKHPGIEGNSSIDDFLNRINEGTASYAIVLYSNDYFRSQRCIWELRALLERYKANGGSDLKNLILVEHEEGNAHTIQGQFEILKFWRNLDPQSFDSSLTTLSPPISDFAELHRIVRDVVDKDLPRLFAHRRIPTPWHTGQTDEIVNEILERIGAR